MTSKQTALLVVTPVALLALGLFGILAARATRVGVRSDSVARFVAAALDRPDKLTEGHVETVVKNAAALEELAWKAQDSAIDSFEQVARGCLWIAALNVVTLTSAPSSSAKASRTAEFSSCPRTGVRTS